jgi:putative transposase
MGNHYHLLVEIPDGNLSIGMRQLNGVYTQWFNRRHKRVGHLFQGRFKAVVVQKESHLLEACRYVVLNPVRAHAVDHPGKWSWSGYGATAGLKKAHPCLTVDWILSQFAPQRAKAQAAYRKFVGEGMPAGSLWRDLRAQSILGDADFAEHLIDHVRGKELITDIPKSQRFAARPPLDRLFDTREIKNRQERNARIEEAIARHGYTQKEVADHLGLHFTSVSRILRNKTAMPRK